MKSKLIVALDVDTFAEATRLIDDLGDSVTTFKVGSQLFTRVGPPIVEYLHARHRQVFLDLKFHDIPNTVAKAVEAAVAHNVFMLTVHTSGGLEMLQAAARGAAGKVLVVGVTVLTSVAGDVEAEVLRRARLAKEAGLAGVVASPQELPVLRREFGADFVIVTPGIRPAGADVGDQKRIMTPRQAIQAGSSYIVVGRPILAAPDRPAAAARVIAEMSAVTS